MGGAGTSRCRESRTSFFDTLGLRCLWTGVFGMVALSAIGVHTLTGFTGMKNIGEISNETT